MRLSTYLLVLVVSLVLSCSQSDRKKLFIEKNSGEVLQVSVEIASTATERALGLMYRKELPEGEGMLFVFSKETSGSFWMKNTPISLDILFIREGRIVDIIEKTVPYSLESLTPRETYTTVLEVPAGSVARHDIRRGDRVRY